MNEKLSVYGSPRFSDADAWKYELLACPFCATAAEWVPFSASHAGRVFQVRCAPCSALRGFGVQTPCVTTAAEAASLWNRRLTPPSLMMPVRKRVENHARWRPMLSGLQLDTPFWTVAYVGLTGSDDPAEGWHWHVHGNDRGAVCASGFDGLRKVAAAMSEDPENDYIIVNRDAPDLLLTHVDFCVPTAA